MCKVDRTLAVVLQIEIPGKKVLIGIYYKKSKYFPNFKYFTYLELFSIWGINKFIFILQNILLLRNILRFLLIFRDKTRTKIIIK